MIRVTNTETFIAKAKTIHGDIYNYDKAVYAGPRNKLVITCKTHGDFERTPENHYTGQGCKECGIDKQLRNSNKDSIVYYIKTADSEGNSVWKIGITSTSVGEIFHGLLKRSSYTFLANL